MVRKKNISCHRALGVEYKQMRPLPDDVVNKRRGGSKGRDQVAVE